VLNKLPYSSGVRTELAQSSIHHLIAIFSEKASRQEERERKEEKKGDENDGEESAQSPLTSFAPKL